MTAGDPAPEREFEIVVITGLSGSGKTLTTRAFEDMGYFCVDNLPVALIPVFADLCARRPDLRRAALVVDVREGTFLGEFPAIFDTLRRTQGHRARLLFFEADDEALIRRFSETRRPHPLASGGSLEEGIRRERLMLEPLRERADLIIDSSGFNVHELRRYIQEHFAPQTGGQPIGISVVSFGYKHGVPAESDLLFDTRFLPNPFFVDGLRGRSGLDPEVRDYLEAIPEYREFLARIVDLVAFLIPQYIREGKSYLTVAVGCTGGRHRSVAMAEAVSRALCDRGYAVKASHRDLDKE
ncbi:MAG: RNase adaptor protein RapZ [Acidobacteria bacterium 13_1_40CM_2_68_10]|nr:MAG: RNase adaptor protein RapZ [Acidobacteria bacterium 13_1_40CM_2_68_10]